MLIPIRVSVRRLQGLPIVEIRGKSNSKGANAVLIETALRIIEKAEKNGAHLLPNKPKEKTTSKNQIFFTLIFRSPEDTEKFVKGLPYMK